MKSGTVFMLYGYESDSRIMYSVFSIIQYPAGIAQAKGVDAKWRGFWIVW